MIELSVVVPLFRSKYIAWLALEGLCRQEGVDFEWELVIAEEIFEESFTEESINGYRKPLSEIGCTNIVYIPLKKWIPLSKKYKLLADNCSESSKIFATCAADMYPPPKRLKTQYDFFNKDQKLDWCASARTISYDIATERIYLHDLLLNKKGKKSDGSNKAIRMDIATNLPDVYKCRYVDGWIWDCFVYVYRTFAKSSGPTNVTRIKPLAPTE